MTRRRFFVPQHLMTGPCVILPPEQSHHLRDVLRLRAGDPVEVFDGEGNAYAGFVECCRREVLVGRLVRLEPSQSPPRQLILAPALIKMDRFEWMLQKATELGVNEFIPMLTRRCNIRLPGHRTGERRQRWKRVVAEASRQCGRSDVPTIRQPVEFELFLRNSPACPYARLLLHEKAARLPRAAMTFPAGVLLCIGPEGGWDPDEISAASVAGFEVFSLGPSVLRSETAAIAAAALFLLHTADNEERQA